MLPLSCIINQQCWIVAGRWCLIINSGMAAFKIVGVDIFPDCLPRLTDIGILGKICFLVFKTAKPSLNHDIVSPTTFALLNAFFNALMTILVSRVSSTSQPTIQRLYQSITAVRYRNPRLMGMYVMSIDHA